jgi:hypothetical protein
MAKNNTPYSHVGIALRVKKSTLMGKEPEPNEQEQLFIIESTQNSHDVEDYFERTVRRGVTIFLLEERLRKIDSTAIWHIPVLSPLKEHEVQRLLNKAMELYRQRIHYDKKQLWPFYFGHQNAEDLHEVRKKKKRKEKKSFSNYFFSFVLKRCSAQNWLRV